MVCQEQQLTGFKFSTVDGRLSIEIPWWNANALRNRLAAQGVRATACFDPKTRIAFLEMDGNVDPESVRALLDGANDQKRAG